MSISLRRFQAEESSFTQSGRRRAMITIPGSVGFTDLSESKVMLEVTPRVRDGNTDIPWPVTFTQPTGRTTSDFQSKACMTGAQSLIRNARVVSRDFGLLNEQRHQNVISTNLDWYQSSRAQEDERALFGNTISDNYGRQSNFVAASPFFEYKQPVLPAGTLQNQAGTVHQAMIPVDWKHIDQFAQIQQFPNAAVGDIDYHIEFEDQINTIQTAESPVNVLTLQDANTGAAGEMPNLVTDRLTSQIVHPLSVGQQVYIRMVRDDTSAVVEGFVRIATIAIPFGNVLQFTVTPALPAASLGNTTAMSGMAIYYGSRISAGGAPYVPENFAVDTLVSYPGEPTHPLVFTDFFGAGAANNGIDYSRNPFVPGQYIGLHSTQTGVSVRHDYMKVVSVNIANNGAGNPTNLELILQAPDPNTFSEGVATAGNITAAGLGYAAPTNGIVVTGGSGTGMKVNVTAVGGGGAVTTVVIDEGGNGYVIGDIVTLPGGTAGSLATYTITAVTRSEITDMMVSIPDHASDLNPFTVDWTIDEVYLQMHVLNLMPQQQENARRALQEGLQIPWLEYRLLQKHTSATTALAEVVELLPNCVGCVVLTPQNLQLASSFDHCTSYRFALDGKEVTDRDITCGMWTTNRSLHNLQLKRFFANIGKDLMKYDAAWMNRSAIGFYDSALGTPADVNTMSVFPLVVPQKNDYTILQIQLFSTTAMQEKNLFIVSAHERTLQFKDGRVQVM